MRYIPAADASQDLLRRQKRAVEYYKHYKSFEKYNEHLISEGHLKLCRFILESEQTVAKYLTVDEEILWGQAIRDHFDVPIRIKKETNKSETSLPIIMDRLIRKDPALAFKVWC